MSVNSIPSAYSNYALQPVLSQTSGTSGSTPSYFSATASDTPASTIAYAGGSLLDQLNEAMNMAMNALGLRAGDRVTFADVEEARKKMEEAFSAQVGDDLLALGVDPDVHFTLVTDNNGGIKVIMDEAIVKRTKTVEGSETIDAMLEELGLESDVAFSLSADGRGGFSVTADQDIKEQIEQYLEDRPGVEAALRKEFDRSGGSAFTLEHGADGLSLSYLFSGKDAKAAIEQYFEDKPEMVEKFNEIQALTNLDQARKGLSLDKSAVRKRVQMESLVAWFAGEGMGVDQLMQYSDGQSLFAASGVNYTV